MPTYDVRTDRCNQPLMHCTDLGLVHYKLCNPQESGGMREATGHNHFDDPFGPSDRADRRLRLRAGEGKGLGYVVGKPFFFSNPGTPPRTPNGFVVMCISPRHKSSMNERLKEVCNVLIKAPSSSLPGWKTLRICRGITESE